MGILAPVIARRASRARLAAQRNELRTLRGDLTQDAWTERLGVAKRTYIRYEQGQRAAPEFLMRLARLTTAGGRRGRRGV